MKRRLPLYTILLPALAMTACSAYSPKKTATPGARYTVRGIALDDSIEVLVDSLYRRLDVFGPDTIHVSYITPRIEEKSDHLTNRDYNDAAEFLGIEAAAVKAIVEIETGRTNSGFHSPGKPIINFDAAVYRRAAARRGIDPSKALAAASGSSQAAHQARFDAAVAADTISAVDGTFWGLFQIGGFNWRLCGATSRADFLQRMSRSERDQLDLFAQFIRNSGLLKHLKAKDWASFARGYNGAGYARNGYHTRLAAAYRKYRAQPDAIPEK